MLEPFVFFAVGVILVSISFYLIIRKLREFLRMTIPHLTLLNTVIPFVLFAAIETYGIDLLVDPLLPGQAIVVIHAEELVRHDTAYMALRARVEVLNLDGTVARWYFGGFNEHGDYVVLASFGWFQSYAKVTVTKDETSSTPVFTSVEHISNLNRLRVTKKEITISR